MYMVEQIVLECWIRARNMLASLPLRLGTPVVVHNLLHKRPDAASTETPRGPGAYCEHIMTDAYSVAAWKPSLDRGKQYE